MDALSSKSDFLGIKPLVKRVTVPSWGRDVFIRPLNKKEKLAVQKLADEKDPFGNEKMVAMSICDADGKRVFDDTDYEIIANLPSVGTDLIADEIVKLNSEADDESKKDSSPTPTGDNS